MKRQTTSCPTSKCTSQKPGSDIPFTHASLSQFHPIFLLLFHYITQATAAIISLASDKSPEIPMLRQHAPPAAGNIPFSKRASKVWNSLNGTFLLETVKISTAERSQSEVLYISYGYLLPSVILKSRFSSISEYLQTSEKCMDACRPRPCMFHPCHCISNSHTLTQFSPPSTNQTGKPKLDNLKPHTR